MLIKNIIQDLQEYTPNTNLIQAYWCKDFFTEDYDNLTADVWEEVVIAAEEMDWSDINEQICNIIEEKLKG